MRFTVDAIAGLAFGADINTLESDDDVIQQHLDKIFPAIYKRLFSLIPIWRYIQRAPTASSSAASSSVNRGDRRLHQGPRARLRPTRRGASSRPTCSRR